MSEALNSPDTIQAGTTSPGVPGPGPTWDARLRGLVTALETRVPGSAAHGRRVAAMSAFVAARLGLDSCEVTRIERAAQVHDVGKIIVSPEILQKPGTLSDREYEEIPLGSRIIGVVDSYDALTSSRPYRGAVSQDAAISILTEEAGRTLDREVVAAFTT